MKKLAIIAAALLMATTALPARAIMLGGYAGIEGGTGETTAEGDKSIQFAGRAWGAGLTYDTNPLTRESFSYRLNLGAQSVTFEPEKGDAMDGIALVCDNAFTFTLATEENARYWLGPTVRFAGYTFNDGGFDIKFSGVGIGVGGGFTYRLKEKWIVSPSLGGVYNMLSGTDRSGAKDVDVKGRLISFYAKVDFLYDF